MARLLLNPRNPPFGEDYILLHGRARQHYATGVHAPLSIKTVLKPGFLTEPAEFRERTHPAGTPLGLRVRALHAARSERRTALARRPSLRARGGNAGTYSR